MKAAFFWFSIGAALAAGAPPDQPPHIVVVTSSGVDAYAQALEGLQTGLAKMGAHLDLVDLELKASLTQLPRSHGRRGDVVVTIGAKAASALSPLPAGVAVFRTMVLLTDHPDPGVTGSVVLNVPPSAVFARLKEMFPGRNRLGILRGPGAVALDEAQLAVQARSHGFTYQVIDCPTPDKLLNSFLSLRKQADLVWCLPGSGLFNSTTVQPLVMTSLSERLPIVGFSESFLRAGAAASLYPDFQDIGLQTAEMVARFLAGEKVPPVEVPRSVQVGVNQRVLRLLGIRYVAPGPGAGKLLEVK